MSRWRGLRQSYGVDPCPSRQANGSQAAAGKRFICIGNMSKLRKVVFELVQDDDGYPPVGSESVWAIPLDENRFVIDNIPFFTCDATLGDVVSANEDMGELRFVSTIKSSGNSLLRLIYAKGSDVEKIRTGLRALGCATEWDEIHRLISISVPHEIALSRVRDFLDSGVEQGISDYEEAIVRE
jgi:Domain of unknown function (DUF4265)